MRPSPRLHQLIKTLTPAEQRYFKLFAQRHRKEGKNLYLKLFTVIHKQKEYDETAVKGQFAGTSFGKDLAFPKSNLYDQTLRSLQAFHYEKSSPSAIRSALDKIDLLANRGLPEQALRVLEKSLVKAEKLEQASLILQLLRWKRQLLFRMQDGNVLTKIALLAGQEQAWEHLFQAEQLAIRLRDSLYIILQEVRRKTQAADEDHLRFIKQELEILHQERELSFETRIALHQADAHYHHLMDDFSQVHSSYFQAVEVWKQHPAQIRNTPSRYVGTIGAWLNSKALIGDHENLLFEIHQLRQQKGLNLSEQAQVFRITYPLELFHYLNTLQFSKAISITPMIAKGLQQFETHLSPNIQLAIYYNLAVMHWLGKQPRGGLTWVNRILQFDSGEVRKDIRALAPLIEKILHHELGNEEVKESWFRSVKYRLSKKEPVPELEKMLLNLLWKITASPELTPGEFRIFIGKLDAYAQQPKVSKLGLNEMKIWAKGKI